MFTTDRFIYIQMQKTGCTHIAKLLSKIFDGKQVGTHNTASKEQIDSDLYFISSIRNPWDWYLSLWTYGVQGRGGVMSRLTKKNRREALKVAAESSSLKDNKQELLNKVLKKVAIWDQLYEDNGCVESFRKWLSLIQDPANANLLGEGYGDSQVASHCGFMSYRYLKTCCSEVGNIKESNTISNYIDLVKFERKNCYIDFFIRQESLESDLCQVLEKIRTLKQEEKSLIWGAKKTNTSVRPLSISEYYDQESKDLVLNRERLLVEKFDYQFPS